MTGWLGAVLPRALALLFVWLLVLAVPASDAFAHAAFLESTPAPGTRLESFPRTIELEFTEPLNRKLTRATLVEAASGERIAAKTGTGAERELVLRPVNRLDTAPYRVEWHTVSTEDGHALEGSFSFGVRAAAAGGEQEIEQSPLARDGWLRIALRGVFYAALFFFAGGLITAVLLSRSRAAAGWLVPEPVGPGLTGAGRDPGALTQRVWVRTLDAGWLAAGGAIAIALAEAADASGGLSLQGASDFLLSNIAGLGRVGTVVALLMAVLLAPRMRLVAAGWCVLAFLTIAISGHANSAEPRSLAVLTDWVHLVAGAVWIGGIAQIATCWLPLVRGLGRALRRAVMRNVLERFGKVALPAFLVVVSTGLVNALIQLGRPGALWETSYGRILAVKIALVGLIALASYSHALRLRPRVLAANPHPSDRLERRHWRLLGSEPLLAVGVVTAAGTLVAFPLPPRQLSEADEAEAALAKAPPCDPCPQRKPSADELSVAEQAGSSIAAVWLKREGRGLKGELRLLDLNTKPVKSDAEIPLAQQESCGAGCWTFRLSSRPSAIEVRVPEKGKLYTARLPARWRAGETERARRLLARAQRTMRALRSFRERETVTSGPGSFAATSYRLKAPDRLAYVTNGRAGTVTIGRRQWFRAGDLPWEKQRYGGGGPPFRTRTWFRWTTYARSVRPLGTRRERGRRIAELALMDPGTPVWYRLKVDLGTMRVLHARMITGGHFMDQRFFAFNDPVTIQPPLAASDGR